MTNITDFKKKKMIKLKLQWRLKFIISIFVWVEECCYSASAEYSNYPKCLCENNLNWKTHLASRDSFSQNRKQKTIFFNLWLGDHIASLVLAQLYYFQWLISIGYNIITYEIQFWTVLNLSNTVVKMFL
jgi:hypothetical protein